MNYVEYNEKIMKQAQRKLVGWPEKIPFRKPGSIGAVTDLRELWAVIEKEQLYFRELTDEEKAALQPADPTDPDIPTTTGKKRKQRSDKGRQRGPRKGRGVSDEVENDGDGVGSQSGGGRSRKRKQMGASPSGAPREKRVRTTA